MTLVCLVNSDLEYNEYMCSEHIYSKKCKQPRNKSAIAYTCIVLGLSLRIMILIMWTNHVLYRGGAINEDLRD